MFKDNFDKLILLAVLGCLHGGLVAMVHWRVDADAIRWIEKSADLALGSLLTLITGGLLRRPAGGAE